MSIEKIDLFESITHEKIPYTQLYTKVLQTIKNTDSLAIWVYLSSLPPEWRVCKAQIKKHFKIGDDKIKQVFSCLKKSNLIEYITKKNDSGKIESVSIKILNGSKLTCTSGVNSTRVENHTSGKHHAIKEINNKLNINNKKNIICAKSKFEQFWSVYPVKKNRKRTQVIWEKGNFDEIFKTIGKDIERRKKIDTQWLNKKYIPHPSTYLRAALWNDEIIEDTSPKNGFDRFMSEPIKGVTYDEYGRSTDPFN